MQITTKLEKIRQTIAWYINRLRLTRKRVKYIFKYIP